MMTVQKFKKKIYINLCSLKCIDENHENKKNITLFILLLSNYSKSMVICWRKFSWKRRHSWKSVGFLTLWNNFWSMAAWDFQQCGMCDQQSLRSPCAYAQSDTSLCWSLDYFMIVKLLTEHHLVFRSLKGGHTGSCRNTTLLDITCRGSFVRTRWFFMRTAEARPDWALVQSDLSFGLEHMFFEPRHVISNKCGILTWIDSDEPVPPPFKLRNSNLYNVESVDVHSQNIQATIKGPDQTAQVDLRLCWSHIPHWWLICFCHEQACSNCMLRGVISWGQILGNFLSVKLFI